MNYRLQSIQERFARKEKLKYVFFWGHTEKNDQVSKACFSQWYPSVFKKDGITYKTAEHFMMAEKARLFNNKEILEEILKSGHPKQAKDLGRRVTGFKNEIWDKEKFRIVSEANFLKFSQSKSLKQFLLNTNERVLVEASPNDKVWGIGMAQDNEHIENPYKWKGENLLGFALMEVRDMLRNKNTEI